MDTPETFAQDYFNGDGELHYRGARQDSVFFTVKTPGRETLPVLMPTYLFEECVRQAQASENKNLIPKPRRSFFKSLFS